jgi:hypothetical protein
MPANLTTFSNDLAPARPLPETFELFAEEEEEEKDEVGNSAAE